MPRCADSGSMQRPATSIVILAWNAWDQTKACLESLRPTLGIRDQVIVVDNGSSDATPSMLRHYSWLQVITNPHNRGFAAGCNQGAARAVHDSIVFLNNDTVLIGRWLDALLAPLQDPTVGATGPRSNFVSGVQVAEGASYGLNDRAAMRLFARKWAQDHRGQTSDVNRLVGFCLAVRRQAFEDVGGFDERYAVGGFEDDDLCRRLCDRGLRLVVAHESFVHHAGHKTFDANGVDWFAQQEHNAKRFEEKFGAPAKDPLISACLITKNEVDNLPTCLASLDGLADEIVVYDTGSTDATVELARSLGATVIEGYWDDDFSRARNAALAHCHGSWIAWLDADESVVCDDRPGLRRVLATTSTEVDGFTVLIDNLTGSGINSLFVHSATRLFRRAQCEWTGRLHEQVSGRILHRPIVSPTIDGYRLRHTGYLDKVMVAKGKVERNIRVAAAEVADNNSWDQGFSQVSLGRSFLIAGRRDEAIAHCRQGYALTRNAVTRRLALRTIAETLLDLGSDADAEVEIGRLRKESSRMILADVLTVRLHLLRQQFQHALDSFDSIGWGQRGDDGFEYDRSMYIRHRVQALVGMSRFGDAADNLLDVLGTKGMLDLHLGALIEYLQKAGRPLTEVADVLPADQRHLLLAQVLQLQPQVADAMLQACWERIDAQAVLAAAASLAPKLPIERQLVWSSRFRQQGYPGACPLLVTATDRLRLPSERLRAAAVVLAAFGDDAALPAFDAAALDLQGTEQRTISRMEVVALAPALVERFDQARTSPPDLSTLPAEAHEAPYLASLVVLCTGDRARTESMLQRVAEITAPERYQVILVGNGAGSEIAELGATLSGHRCYRHLEQVHDSHAAYQIGVEEARGWATVLLTTAVDVRPGWLEGLLLALAGGATVAGPVVVGGDDLVFSAGTEIRAGNNGLPGIFGARFGNPADSVPKSPTGVEALGTAGLTIATQALASLGGIDPSYSSDFGAADLCLRVIESKGSVVVSGTSCLLQRVPDTRPDQAELVQRDARRFADRWQDLLRSQGLLFDIHTEENGDGPAHVSGEPAASAHPGDSSSEHPGPRRPGTIPPRGLPRQSPSQEPVPTYYGHERPEVVALVPEDAGRVLDIGCAAGRLGAAIKRRQPCHVMGVELDHVVAERARAQLDEVRVLDLNRDHLDLSADSLDCVVCADVLEHLVDPWSVVGTVREALRPGGTLVVSIPNIRNLGILTQIAEGTFDYADAGILDRTHLRFFTRRTFTQLLVDAGFHIEHCSAVQDPSVVVDRDRVQGSVTSLSVGRLSIANVTPGEIDELATVQFLFRARKPATPEHRELTQPMADGRGRASSPRVALPCDTSLPVVSPPRRHDARPIAV